MNRVCTLSGAVEVKGDEGESTDLLLPSGVVVSEDNAIKYPDGSSRGADGTMHLPDGRTLGASEFEAGKSGRVLPDGCVLLPTGCFEYPSGVASTRDGKLLSPDGSVSEAPWELPAPQPALNASASVATEPASSEAGEGSGALKSRVAELEKELAEAQSQLAESEEKLSSAHASFEKSKNLLSDEMSFDPVDDEVAESEAVTDQDVAEDEPMVTATSKAVSGGALLNEVSKVPAEDGTDSDELLALRRLQADRQSLQKILQTLQHTKDLVPKADLEALS